MTELTDYRKLVELGLSKHICEGSDCNEELWFTNVRCRHSSADDTFVTTIPNERSIVINNQGNVPTCRVCNNNLYLCTECEGTNVCDKCKNKCCICKGELPETGICNNCKGSVNLIC